MSNQRIKTDKPSDWVGRIWRQNSTQIYKLCCLRSRNIEEAKDLFQEVALRFCKYAHSLDWQKPILPWFCTVIRNTYCDLNRRTLHMTPLSHLADNQIQYDLTAIKIANEVNENRRKEYARLELNKLMKCLNNSERMAIEFACIGEFRSNKACLFCGVSKGTFSKRKSAAIKKMKEQRGILEPNLYKRLTYASEIS